MERPPDVGGGGDGPPCDLAVVVGARDGGAALESCLAALRRELAGHRARVVVPHAALGDEADRLAARFPEVEMLSCPPDLLVPELWGAGLGRTPEAPLSIVLSGACVPEPGWLEALLRASREHPEAAGIGGPIDGPGAVGGEGSAAGWAVHFTRYTAYAPPVSDGEVDEIPGDNALYRRETLEHAWIDREDGFWETLVHRRVRERGGSLRMAPQAVVRLGPVAEPWAFVRDRFRHGRHFGATRPLSGRSARLARAAVAPALPVLLLVRIARTTLRRRRGRLGALVRSLPWLLLYLGAWSAGEAAGYLAGR